MTSKCYEFFPTLSTWDDAKATCNRNGGELASIHERSTNYFLTHYTDKIFWVGGYEEEEGVWKWTDGSPWDYENWTKENPSNWKGHNQDKLAISYRIIGKFDDDFGHVPRPFICQYDLGP